MSIEPGLDYKVAGENGQNVVFLNGFRMSFESWNKIYPDIARHSRVLLFNRRGIGASPKAAVDQIGLSVVEDMWRLERGKPFWHWVFLFVREMSYLFWTRKRA